MLRLKDNGIDEMEISLLTGGALLLGEGDNERDHGDREGDLDLVVLFGRGDMILGGRDILLDIFYVNGMFLVVSK